MDSTSRRVMESENRQSVLSDFLSTLLLNIDEKGLILYANPSFYRVTGYTEHDLIGNSIFPFLKQEDAKHFTYRLSISANTYGKVFKYRIGFVTKSQKELKFELTITNHLNHPKLKCIVVEAQESAYHTISHEFGLSDENLFKLIWDNSQDAMRLVDENGIMLMVNQAFCKSVEKSEEELIGRELSVIYNSSLKQISDEDARREQLEHFKLNMRERNVPIHLEKQLFLWNGKKVWFELSNAFLTHPDGRILLLSVFRDTTEKKLAERRVRDSETLFRGIFDTSPLGIVTLDLETRLITNANPAFQKMLGYSLDELKTMPLSEFTSSSSRKAEREGMEKMLRREISVYEHEKAYLRKDGTTFTAKLFLTFLREPDGEPTLMLGIIDDISEEEEMRRKQTQMVSELSRNNSLKDRLLSIISHDLRSPFTGLLGFSEELYYNFSKLAPDEVHHYHGLMYRSLHSLYETLENLLTWTRLQSGKLTANFITFNLIALIQNVLDSFKATLDKKGIKLLIVAPDSLVMQADTAMMQSILTNLLSNAFKFSYKESEIRVTVTDRGGELVLAVRDFGMGISEETLSKIVKDHKTISRRGTENEAGTGLGLAILYEMVELHGGDMKIKSKEGEGTEVSITFPKTHH